MKPLIVLLTTFVVSTILYRITSGTFQVAMAARIAMAVMLVFTAIGHFKFPEGMALMIPKSIPFKLEMIYLTGVLEIAGAIGLLVPGWRGVTGWCLILFFLLILPANIHAALHHVNFEKAGQDGPGPAYLWFRIPLQALFIGWIYFSTLRG